MRAPAWLGRSTGHGRNAGRGTDEKKGCEGQEVRSIRLIRPICPIVPYVPYVSYVPVISKYTRNANDSKKLYYPIDQKSAKPGNADRGTEKKKGDWAKRKVNPTTENNLGKNQLLVQGKPWL